MVLVQKWPFFQVFFLGKIGQENVFYDILERKSAFLGQWNKKFKKFKKFHFSKGVNPWLWSKNGHFLQLFVLGNISQESVFYDIPERKNAFLGQKNKKFKKSKIDIFLKGLTDGFGPRMAICPTIIFRQDRPGKCLLRDSRTRKRLSRPKNMKFKKSKNWLFF